MVTVMKSSFDVDVTTGTPDEGCCSPLSSHAATGTSTGWRFVQKPTRHASSRQFESQPAKTRGRYEQPLNAHP
jgi:hypothetical protein